MKSSVGFTLVEIVVVLVILTMLSYLAIPLAETTEVKAREKKLRDALTEFRQAIDSYQGSIKYGENPWPITVGSLTRPIPGSLLRIGANPGPFLAAIPENPFFPGGGAYVWNVRSSSGSWEVVRSPDTIIASGIYDVKFAPTPLGFTKALDGSFYEEW